MFSGKNSLFLFFSLFTGLGFSQTPEFLDTIHSSSLCSKEDYRFDISLGQFFISGPSTETGVSKLKCFGNPGFFPVKHSGLAGTVRIVTFGPKSEENYGHLSSSVSGSGQTTFRLAPSEGLSLDPGKTLWEFFPDPKQPFNLFLHNGMGNSRLDLSGLSILGVDITAGMSDVILTWSKPNQVEMNQMRITGGMGKIVIRNIEMSRAKTIQINNGLGETRVFVGNGLTQAQVITVEVGAGTFTLMTDMKVPMKLVIMKSLLSTVEVPEFFSPQGDNIYVNQAYLKQPSKAIQMNVDVGMGNFTVIPSGN